LTADRLPPEYEALAREILSACGGPANVGGASHCATRLRLELRDPEAADRERLARCPGLAGIIKRGNGLHLVFGAEVVYIYREFVKALPAR